MIYSIQRDEGAQALENHLNVIDSKKSLRIEYLAKQLKSCDAKLKGLSNGSQLQQVRCREGSAFLFFTKTWGFIWQ